MKIRFKVKMKTNQILIVRNRFKIVTNVKRGLKPSKAAANE